VINYQNYNKLIIAFITILKKLFVIHEIKTKRVCFYFNIKFILNENINPEYHPSAAKIIRIGAFDVRCLYFNLQNDKSLKKAYKRIIKFA